MGYRLRWIPPTEAPSAIAPEVSWTTSDGWATVELTVSTVRSTFLLRPSRRLREITVGVLARAQKATGARIHMFTYLSTHGHLLCSFRDVEQMARFNCYLQGNLAREVCVLTDWKGRVWARPYSSTVLSQESAVLAERLRYQLENGCKENLVWSPLSWPGASAAHALARGKRTVSGRWIDRSAHTLAKRTKPGISQERFTTNETVELSPLPGYENDWEGYIAYVRQLITTIESETERRHRTNGTTPLGLDAIRDVHPHHIPETKRDRSPAPLAFASTKSLRIAFRQMLAEITATYRAAAERLRLGDISIEFPPGTFPPSLPIRLGPLAFAIP